MGVTWEEATSKICNAAPDYGEKAEELSLCASWDRRTVDLKGLIDSIAEILDPKRLRWTTRVGQVIGQREPRNELFDFLGKDLVTALWSNQERVRK